jgi:hypothetical protein
MFGGIQLRTDSVTIEKLKQRVSEMSDAELIRQGKMLRDLCKGPNPPDIWVQELKILREEWSRRHPKTA